MNVKIMKSFIISIFISLGSLGLQFAQCQEQQSEIILKDKPNLPAYSSRKISLMLSNVTLADIVEILGQKYGIPIVADSLINDIPIKSISYSDQTINGIISKIATQQGRELHYINGVAVLRARNFVIRYAQEKIAIQTLNFRWPDMGKVKAGRYNEKGEFILTQPVKTSIAGTKRIPYSPVKAFMNELPARFILLEAKNATAATIVYALKNSSNLYIHLDPLIGRRRMTTALHYASSGQAVEAIAFLLNASPIINIEQSDSQKKLEAYMSDERLEREKLSDSLEAKLTSKLTDEQRQKIAAGEQVPITLSSMSDDIRSEAEYYALNALSAANRDLLDTSRLKDFAIVFMPKSAGIVLGVNGFGKDGNGFYY